MPAVLREHVPSMLGMGLLLAACGHDLTPAQPRAAKLAFLVEPTRTEGTVPIKPGPQVIILDQFGDTVPDATNTVTVALGANPSGATLTGTTTVTAAAGVASFSDLHIDRPGSGYTLLATAPGLAGAMSVAFRIGLTIAALSAGDHTCAVTTVGASYCWGFNSAGQLGDGTTDRKSTPVLVIMPAGVRFAAVSAGGDHTCGVTPGGTAYCWGWNQDGQLGDGTRVDRRTPVPVAAPAGVGFAAVSLGGWHTCGVTLGGTAYCWGHNAYGQLGDGTDTSRTIPVAVSVPAGLSFAAVSAGFYHTCGLATTRAAYCWAVATADSAARAPTPVATPEGVSFVAVSTGGVHACGLTAAGSAYCWGDNNYGKLGDGTTTSSATPVPVAAPVGVTFAQLSAGGEHTCGRTDAGAVYCWGQNGSGQLGDGTIPFNRTTPTAVAAPQGVVFAHVSAGWNHTCAMTAAGAGYCWGSNVGGELGDGTFVTSPVPVQIVQ